MGEGVGSGGGEKGGDGVLWGKKGPVGKGGVLKKLILGHLLKSYGGVNPSTKTSRGWENMEGNGSEDTDPLDSPQPIEEHGDRDPNQCRQGLRLCSRHPSN